MLLWNIWLKMFCVSVSLLYSSALSMFSLVLLHVLYGTFSIKLKQQFPNLLWSWCSSSQHSWVLPLGSCRIQDDNIWESQRDGHCHLESCETQDGNTYRKKRLIGHLMTLMWAREMSVQLGNHWIMGLKRDLLLYYQFSLVCGWYVWIY